MKKTALLAIATVGILASCVPGRQHAELQSKFTQAELELADNKTKAGDFEAKNKELHELLDNAMDENHDLKQDTSFLGHSKRQLQNQYDKLNELNDAITQKNNALMADQIRENKKLLEDLGKTREELFQKENDLNRIEDELNKESERLETMSSELESREAMVMELQELLAKKDEASEMLRLKVAAALNSFKDKGLTVEQRDGKVYVSMEANLLFPSGSTVINNEGKQALIDLAKAIETQSDLEIVVEGHTDTDKIRSNSIPRDNWELSVLRATSVVKIMTANSVIKPEILSASGKSEFVPIDEADKSKNRRIEIILTPNLDELFKIIDNE